MNSFGIIYKYDRLDYKYNPRKGFLTKGDLQFGFKNILSQSDTLIETSGSSNYQFDLTIESYLPLGKKSTLKLGCNFASIINPILYENELHRIGGNNLLRGFDEESIWVSSFLINCMSQYWQVYKSRMYKFTLEKRGFRRLRCCCFSMITAGTRVSQVGELTIQSSYQSNTVTLSIHR